MSKVRVTYNDPTVHCIDILNARGAYIARVRPQGNGYSFTIYEREGNNAFLSAEDLQDLASALEHLRPS